jgi:hypothetical protein
MQQVRCCTKDLSAVKARLKPGSCDSAGLQPLQARNTNWDRCEQEGSFTCSSEPNAATQIAQIVPRRIWNGQQDQVFICLAGRNGKYLPGRLGPARSSL